MLESLIMPAFILGLLGSLHCVGMCEPIALSLPENDNLLSLIANHLFYNLGRVSTYVILGMIIGLFGEAVSLVGIQTKLSIIAGAVLISGLIFNKINRGFHYPGKSALNEFISKSIGRLFRNRHPFSFFSIGVLNGILPCGFVYIGLIGAFATGSVMSSMVFMLLFGLGTIPAMYILSVSGKSLTFNIRNYIKRLTSYAAIVLGILFILRGLSLGIPYISPNLNEHVITQESTQTHGYHNYY